MVTKTAKRASVFDAIIETGQENAARLEESFSGPALEVATRYVRPNPNNPRTRISRASVDEIANAIRQAGEILQPLLVRPVEPDEAGHRYEVVCGNRRLRGAQQLDLPKIPVRVRDLTDDEAARFALWENLAREDLDPMDLADSIEKLRRIDRLTWPELAARFGFSRQWVYKLQKMAELPEPVKDMVRDKRLSSYNATLLTQVTTGETDVVALAQEISERRLTSRQVEKMLDERKPDAGIAERKGAFTLAWSLPPGYEGRRYSRLQRAVEQIVGSIQEGKMTPELARALEPVTHALTQISRGAPPSPPPHLEESPQTNRPQRTSEGPG